jgi:hypothetical protein
LCIILQRDFCHLAEYNYENKNELCKRTKLIIAKWNCVFTFVLCLLFCLVFLFCSFVYFCGWIVLVFFLMLLVFFASFLLLCFCLFVVFFRFCVSAFFYVVGIFFLLLPMMKRKGGLFIVFTFLTNNITTITIKQRHTLNRNRKQRFHTYKNHVT